MIHVVYADSVTSAFVAEAALMFGLSITIQHGSKQSLMILRGLCQLVDLIVSSPAWITILVSHKTGKRRSTIGYSQAGLAGRL